VEKREYNIVNIQDFSLFKKFKYDLQILDNKRLHVARHPFVVSALTLVKLGTNISPIAPTPFTKLHKSKDRRVSVRTCHFAESTYF
jgi:hypothetical protein